MRRKSQETDSYRRKRPANEAIKGIYISGEATNSPASFCEITLVCLSSQTYSQRILRT